MLIVYDCFHSDSHGESLAVHRQWCHVLKHSAFRISIGICTRCARDAPRAVISRIGLLLGILWYFLLFKFSHIVIQVKPKVISVAAIRGCCWPLLLRCTISRANLQVICWICVENSFLWRPARKQPRLQVSCPFENVSFTYSRRIDRNLIAEELGAVPCPFIRPTTWNAAWRESHQRLWRAEPAICLTYRSTVSIIFYRAEDVVQCRSETSSRRSRGVWSCSGSASRCRSAQGVETETCSRRSERFSLVWTDWFPSTDPRKLISRLHWSFLFRWARPRSSLPSSKFFWNRSPNASDYRATIVLL